MLKNKNTTIRNTRCELVSGEDVSHLEGKLKTVIDAIIPESEMLRDEKRSKAIKDIINTVLWNWFNYITNMKTDHLEEKKEWYKEEK